jgi:NADPH:quinone reductase-like Zn-dependent oxidoreductase
VIIPAFEKAAVAKQVTLEQTTAISIQCLTAWRLPFKSTNAERGECVLVHSAAGGIGYSVFR